MNSSRHFLALAGVLLALALWGCGTKSSTRPATISGNDRLVSSADSVLGVVLTNELGSNPQHPSDLDFQPAYNSYYQAYQSSDLSAAGRVHARFGLAVLGLMILTSDPAVNAAFDEWRAYLQTRVPFQVTPSPRAPIGIRAGFAPGAEALKLPFDVVPLSLVSLTPFPLGAVDPQISGVQAILRDRALPRLTEAIAHLDAVAADVNFTFIVTPAMQGDPAAEPVEIDRTDVMALRAACRLLSAACRVAVAYVLNFPAYDEVSLAAAIQPGSAWLGLAPGGAVQMGLAQLDLVGSIDDLSSAISSLMAETDVQDNDVIRVGPRGVSQASLDSLRLRLPQVRQAMTSGYTLVRDWDHNLSTPEVALTIRPGALFTNPVPNWKSMVPAYTGSTEHRFTSVTWVYNFGASDIATMVAGGAGSYSGGFSRSVYLGGTYEYEYGDAAVIAGIRSLIQARQNAITSRPDWAGDYNGASDFSGSLAAGSNAVKVFVNETYSLAGRTIAVPVITWVASQYSDWTWPDPTFRGFLPGITSTNELLTTFGFNPNSWARTVVLDWSRFAPPPPPPPGATPRSRRQLAGSRGGR